MKDKYLVRVCKTENCNHPYFIKRKRNGILKFLFPWKILKISRDGEIYLPYRSEDKIDLLEFLDETDPFNTDEIIINCLTVSTDSLINKKSECKGKL